MLTHLQVRDLAIVSQLELDCPRGMTALTGETGAGKSILIDALSLALGDKAEVGMIRAGSERAEIVAEFDLATCPGARDWLAEQELDDEGGCILRRLIVREGRSRAYINGRPASGAQLRDLGNLLVDIHGQHAHQSLLRANAQRDLLDAYGGHRPLADAVAKAFRDFRTLDQKLAALETAFQERSARLDLLRFQVQDLESLGLTAADIESLDQEQRRLSHLGRLQETAARVLQTLAESEPSIEDHLRAATAELAELAVIDPGLTESRELLETAAIHAGEAAASLRHYLDGLDLDPAALETVETRLAQVHDLARKYRVFPSQLPETLIERRAELNDLEQADVTLAGLRESHETAWQDFLTLAQRLGDARATTADRLAETVSASMQQLGMAGGRFAVQIDPLPRERVGSGGLERIDFLVSANPGQPLQPLAKVASGGELSRISLGIQVATAECGSVPTLVFDEVDVGIGGGVAEIVGRLLHQLGDSRQVLCVTHLPQVAAQAHAQLRVRKETLDGQTHTRIEPLDATDRVEEIARMLGGTEITARTRDHASEMLNWGR
ncbi:DNA repair protein RecN [Thiocystis violascens]|uniref:DNA repair protein RecN n=1 Tax=Thiocystis violascens (strain ATCC 17096 / DSM 198 / 6111) TaxID=765911 RepID=I3YHB7_THIV6|nr:DNA repair protein RecN [Thiocystis violascens]AFL76385.1 DNA replication and repair protein RecN [Thiocystis violascens DSM 198]